MRRHPGDNPVLARGPRVPRQVALLVPGGRAERGAAQRGARRRGVDGRVGAVLLRHEPRFEDCLGAGCYHFDTGLCSVRLALEVEDSNSIFDREFNSVESKQVNKQQTTNAKFFIRLSIVYFFNI